MARRPAAVLTLVSGSVCGVCSTIDLLLYSHHVPGQGGYFQDWGGKRSKEVTLKTTRSLVRRKSNLRSTPFYFNKQGSAYPKKLHCQMSPEDGSASSVIGIDKLPE